MAGFNTGDKVRVKKSDTWRNEGDEGVVSVGSGPYPNALVTFPTPDKDGDFAVYVDNTNLELLTDVVLRESDLPPVAPVDNRLDAVNVGKRWVFRDSRAGDLEFARALIAAHRHFDANPESDPETELARVMAGEAYLNPLEIARFLPAARRVLAAHDVTPKTLTS